MKKIFVTLIIVSMFFGCKSTEEKIKEAENRVNEICLLSIKDRFPHAENIEIIATSNYGNCYTAYFYIDGKKFLCEKNYRSKTLTIVY